MQVHDITSQKINLEVLDICIQTSNLYKSDACVQCESVGEVLGKSHDHQLVNSLLNNFCEFLKIHDQHYDFVNLAWGLINNTIEVVNMSWLAALHMGKYSNLKTMCQMKYHPACV